MNPHFPLSVLVPLALLVAGVAVFSSWRTSAGLSPSIRALLLSLRIIAVTAVAAILFNPGKWTRPASEKLRPWLVLADVSSSMSQPATPAGETRAAISRTLATLAASMAKDAGIPLSVHPFSHTLAPAVSPSEFPDPTGSASAIIPSLSQALQQASAAGESLAGLIVLSDGRETLPFSQTSLDDLALRSRARNVAIHTVAIGADAPAPDLAILQNRSLLTAFPGQPLRIPFAVSSTGLDPRRITATLHGEEGEIATTSLDLPPGETITAVFETTAPSQSARWTIAIPVDPAEVRSANNRSTLTIRIIASKTRVFLAEGAPYWDSKFLAQLLRQQAHMDVHSVHRLSGERYFRIDSGSDQTEETSSPVFPADLNALSRYDLVVFGKNIDPFLTPGRAEALRSYVRDHGAAILFSRGKPTTADHPELEPLEPVTWTPRSTADFRFHPTSDGEVAGLFGQALPAPGASLWHSLPTLKDGRAIDLVKPFTRVLATGRDESGSGHSKDFPALLVRRYGQGVVGLVNGDGLWRWDFFPEARELGNHYEDFWTQLIQWMASYSEFLPGQDFSLRTPSARASPGDSVPATLSYRGSEPVPQPEILITSPSGETTTIRPASLPDPSGRPFWRASFTPDTPGDWKLTVIDPRESAPPAPEVHLTVPAPPSENDDLSPDPAFLASIASTTGGKTIPPSAFAAFLDEHLATLPPATPESGAIWKPFWNHASIAIFIAALLALEWFFRRRQGLS